ncbi:hypothetical protein AAG570_007918 [Ranatra chinensis]|uniref:Uncharacterized protein n=1 Tax=Ranatra chinensis TaxID=642074 RepID=A0ABD0XT83_9HEMI
MVISDFGEVGSTLKAFISSQTTACHDTLKWAFKEKNLVLKEALQHFNELQALWTQVQLEFIAGIKKFRRQYEIILEGEQQIDKCRAHLSSCEARENKLRKDLKKAISKASGDGRIYEERLYAVKSLVKSAQTELNDKVSNHEAVKMIAIKEGFINISESYLELAEKAIFIFEAYEGIAKGLPDVNDNDIQNIKYTGGEYFFSCRFF